MIKFVKNNWFDLTVIVLFCISVLFSSVYGYEPVIEIAKNHFEIFLIEMLSFLPLLFILIGLFSVWVPKEAVTKYVGEYSGIKGIMIVILLATLQAGPLYGAFPVAQLLWKKGCSIRNIFIYLGAFSSLKLPMLTFEISFLGLKFSLLRTIISIPVFIVIGIVMERYLKKRNFEIANV
ncbi:MAG: permease [Bacteroidota bacterium]|nr:permease [Bacteroidota bacterium]